VISGWTYRFCWQYQYTVASGEATWNTNMPLFTTVNLTPLTTNTDQPTEMVLTVNYSAIALGDSNGKRLLLELNNNNNPFTYINDTSKSSEV
jgi:hypothetical protein